MKTNLVLFLALLFSLNSFAQTIQVVEDWAQQTGTQSFFMKAVSKTDSYGNVFVTGSTLNSSGNYDVLISKFNSSGALLWSDQYDGAGNGNDAALAMYVDDHCNVYLTGTTYTSPTDSNDVFTMMYDSTGSQQWVSIYSGSSHQNDWGSSIIDEGGKIYVGGVVTTGTTYADYLILRYDTSGSLVWSNSYSGSMNDLCTNIVINRSGEIVLGGAKQTALTDWDYLTVRYDYSGSYLGSTTTSGGTAGFDRVTGMQVDGHNNIYLTGTAFDISTGYDFFTVKLDSLLNIIWTATSNSGGTANDVANAIGIDTSGNVFVTGYSETATNGTDFLTYEYDSSGSELWSISFNGTANGADTATALVVDATGNVIITGTSWNGTAEDYYTIKYDYTGAEQWEINYNDKFNLNDKATAIALDTVGNIIVAGQSQEATGRFHFNVVRYSEASVTIPPDTESISGAIRFLANKDQLIKTNFALASDIRFYSRATTPEVFMMDDTLSYQFFHPDTSVAHYDSIQRVNMWFNKTRSPLVPIGVDDSHTNFYLGHIPEGRPRVPAYEELFQHTGWSDIDLLYSSNGKGLRYYFIVNSGGNSANINMHYAGYDTMYVFNDSLVIETSLGNIIQPRPAVFEIDSSGANVPLSWRPKYHISGNVVTFDSIGLYNNHFKLVYKIDWAGSSSTASAAGNLDWCTFYEGGSDQFHDIRTDKGGNIYITGNSASAIFQTTALAVQVNHSGGVDAVALKFDRFGQRQFATFYGGTLDCGGMGGNTWGESIDTDTLGHIYFTGYTNCSDFPPHASSFSGGYNFPSINCAGATINVFLVKLDPTGSTNLWATYVGGNTSGDAKDLKTDSHGNVYIVGSFADTVSMPIVHLAGAYNNSISNGGFLLKFNAKDSMVWNTRIGTDVNSVDVDKFDNVYITGTINSSDSIPILNAGGNIAYGGGQSDAFVTKFYASDTVAWSTRYGGNGRDKGIAIAASKNDYGDHGYVFITGTAHNSHLHAAGLLTDPGNGAYYDSLGGGIEDAFIAQFDIYSGIRKWATYYSGNDIDQVQNIGLDYEDNVYVTGYTYSTNFPFPSPNLSGGYVQGSLGSVNPFLGVFRHSEFEYIWGTFVGGSDAGMAVASSGDTLYLTGYTSSGPTDFPLVNPGSPTYYHDINPGQEGFICRFYTTNFTSTPEDKIVKTKSLLVYPNPTTNSFTVNFNNPEKSGASIVLINTLGQQVMREEVKDASGDFRKTYSLVDMTDGIYFLRVISNEKIIGTAKIIKQH